MLAIQRPELLWLLLVLLVPLILYLLPMPRRQVATSALFLWERFLRSERLGRTSERFRRALGLALFLGILASLVLAAAGPALGRAPSEARRLLVLVNVSASMNAMVDGQSNLDRAKAAAQQVIESLGSRTEVAVAEAAGGLNVLAPLGSGGRRAVRAVQAIEPFDGPTDVGRVLDEVDRLWGKDVSLYVFTDSALPEGSWSERTRTWIAPPAGDNAAIVSLAAERRGKEIVARFTVANYGSTPRRLSGSVLVHNVSRASNPREVEENKVDAGASGLSSPRGSVGTSIKKREVMGFEPVTLQPGETAERSVRIEETGAAALVVKLDTGQDALRADDEAYAIVPSLEELSVRVAWPNESTRNAYVHAVLAALQDEGVIGAVSEASASPAQRSAATVFVDHAPTTWPEGGAIVLYPLRSGGPGQPHRAAPTAAIEVKGLRKEPVTITRQARHELLRDVDLRGLVVKGAVESVVPEWAEPLAWAGEPAEAAGPGLPVVWAGVTGKTKVLFVGIPLAPFGSRLPFVASFPSLMRNALLWMLPSPEIRRPGDRVAGWTSRRTGLVASTVDGAVHAFSVLSAAESDLRRPQAMVCEPIPHRRPLAAALVALAIALLAVEWGLFHRRVTE